MTSQFATISSTSTLGPRVSTILPQHSSRYYGSSYPSLESVGGHSDYDASVGTTDTEESYP